MFRRHGLRTQALLALLVASLIALVPVTLLGTQLLTDVRTHFGEAFATQFTGLNRQNILAPVSRDLALSRRFADTQLLKDWMQDEADPIKRERLFREAAGYARDFTSGAWFVVSAVTHHYYFHDPASPFNGQPRYTLDPNNPDNAWFFNLVGRGEQQNINVNRDAELGTTRVWLNVLVKDGERALGLAGTGIDLTRFLDAFIASGQPGVTPMIVDASGAIQAHPDPQMIAYNTTTQAQQAGERNLFALLDRADDQAALRAHLAQLREGREGVTLQWVSREGRPQLLALTWLPELQWHVVTLIDLDATELLDQAWIRSLLLVVGLMLGILLIAFSYATERVLIRPLRRLTQSATLMAQGNYDIALPASSRDEIGDLNRAFASMAQQVRQHTEELEAKVLARTEALEQSNREMRSAQKLISDSIDYASMIQRAILPDHRLTQLFGEHHFVLWRPRDVVGGDFYLSHSEGEQTLVGIVDCAGHGVPGALMTMLARAALDHAIGTLGIRSPADLLQETDRTIRGMLQESQIPRTLATNMDVGLVLIDRPRGELVFAGARIALYSSDGTQVQEHKGGRRALVDRKSERYENQRLPIDPRTTYYLTTDGFLDQAGGTHGFGMGATQFRDLLLQNARLPLTAQADNLQQALDDYRGHYPQRDDITLLAFRVTD